MNPNVLAVMTKLRMTFLLLGVAWAFGVGPPPWYIRIPVLLIIAAALIFNYMVDEQQARTKVPPPAGYRTAA